MSTAAGFGTLTFTGGCLHEPRAVPEHPLERQMSKRKPAKASTRARSPKPKTAAKAQRANQAVVRSPKPSRLRSAAAGSSASPSKHHNVSNQEVPVVENTTSLPIADKMAAVLRDDSEQAMNDSKQRFGFSSLTVNAQAHPAKLLEVALANMQFTFEFTHRLATIKSPFEIPGLFAELTSKQMAMFRHLVLSSQSLSRQ